ncbi:MAG: hypothetical protein D6711_01325 [Chloroflexi bacterium]|nr:MAG: hypothetical protein D6711_01325 [Chloroflexota bacterium]
MEQQINRLERYIQRMQAQSERFVRWRLRVFFIGIVAMFLAFQVSDVAAWLVFVTLVGVFVVLIVLHRRLNDVLQQFIIWQQIKKTQWARQTLDWDHIPSTSTQVDKNHPYALDIDIVGEYSIYRLLDNTISVGGSHRLLDWLLQDRPNLAVIHQRQAQLKQLIPLRMFRDKLTLHARLIAGEHQQTKWAGDFLLTWLNERFTALSGYFVLILVLLSLANIGLFLLAYTIEMPPLWIITFVIYMVLSGWAWSHWASAASDSMRLERELKRLFAVLNYLENYNYRDDYLIRAICQPILTSRPSKWIRRLTTIVGALGLRGNPVVWFLLNVVIPWDVFWTWRLQQAKQDLHVTLPRWLDAWYELDALNALAEYAYYTPGVTFPIVTERAEFCAEQIGHPLIPNRVCNDFDLTKLGQVVIITGSNMSGKSSFLRTLGVNMVLAYAGGCVLAQTLKLGLFRLFSCIRVTDSVVDGISYFYAEVRRLRALLEAAQHPDDLPLFFLIDEIFRGTNNRERLIGSRSYIKALVGSYSMGLVATHDLELVQLAETFPQISNYHFREKVEDDRMVFDYILRVGPSPTTNALKIMSIAGLPVEY